MKEKKTISIIKIYYLKNKFKIFCILLVFYNICYFICMSVFNFNAIINAIKDIMNFNNCYDSNFLNVLFTNEEK